MLSFIIGAFTGSILTIFIMCLAISSGRADEDLGVK